MIELRRVRFACIDGLRRSDLPVAGEVWLDDLFSRAWTTREAMKLGTYLVRYMAKPDPGLLTLSSIEGQLQLSGEQTKFALRLMQMYGAVEGFTIEKEQVKIALHLSVMQRIKVLEAVSRLEQLLAGVPRHEPIGEEHWVPIPTAPPETSDDTLAEMFAAELVGTS